MVFNIEYTMEAYLCQRVVPHLRNESPHDQSRTMILRTETMTKSLNMIPQHQLLGVWMQVHLLVYPVRHRIAVQVVLEQRQGHDQRYQSLAVVLDEAQEFLLAVLPRQAHRDGAPVACPHRTGGFSGNPSPPGESYLAFSTMSRKLTLEVAPMP